MYEKILKIENKLYSEVSIDEIQAQIKSKEAILNSINVEEIKKDQNDYLENIISYKKSLEIEIKELNNLIK